jgi:hypothetical protein
MSDEFSKCANDVAKFYGEPYHNQQSNLGIKGEPLAAVILSRYSAKTLSHVFAARRKDGETIVHKIGRRLQVLRDHVEMHKGEPAQQMKYRAMIEELEWVIQECIRG